MQRYPETDDVSNINWTNFIIIVKTENDAKALKDAFRHIHDSDIDTGFVTVNELAHQYQDANNIVVDETLYIENRSKMKWVID